MSKDTLPVVEVFGPTIQGEGSHQGETCHFVRLGGCDFKCEWCDTPHAVIASEVRENKRDLTPKQIVDEVGNLRRAATWVVLSGGNPALHDLSELIYLLHEAGFKVAVETQGSRPRRWFDHVDSLCLSPKPPSSGMALSFSQRILKTCVSQFEQTHGRDLFYKVVVFSEDDLAFLRYIVAIAGKVPVYASAGNDAGRTVGNPTRVDDRNHDGVVFDLLQSYHWLVDRVLEDPTLAGVTVQCQAHVLLWGNKQGV